MSAPIASLFAFRRCLQMTTSVNSVNTFLHRMYGSDRKRKKSRMAMKDPRQNTQYPFYYDSSPGNPHNLEPGPEFDAGRAKDKDIVRNSNKHKKDTAVQNIESFNANKKSFTEYGHMYEKLKDGDLRLGRTLLKAKSSIDSGTILLEGYRLIKDAILLGAEIKYLYFCREEILKDLSPSILRDAQIFKILYQDMKTWSDTTTPPGILAVFKRPKQGELCSTEGPRVPLTVILDGLKDPGNVGTLIRTAAAVGCERILAVKGCVDLWEGKVLRSGMGGHFAIPIYNGLTWSQVYAYIKDNTQVFLADARTEADVITDFNKSMTAEQVDQASTESDSDSSSSDSDDEEPATVNAMSDTKTDPRSDVYNRVPFPVIPYSNIILHEASNARNGHSVALVIGNETKGLSSPAKKFAYNCYGTFVTIPMNPTVDSLNTAVAGSIVLYEIRRKLLELSESHSVR